MVSMPHRWNFQQAQAILAPISAVARKSRAGAVLWSALASRRYGYSGFEERRGGGLWLNGYTSGDTGAVVYTLTNSRTGLPVGGGPLGRLRVQMLDDQRIQAEIFSLSASASAFSGNAVIFVR
jgi:hypothetical protein